MTVVVIVNPYDRPPGAFVARRWAPVGHWFMAGSTTAIKPFVDIAPETGRDMVMLEVASGGRCAAYQMPPGISLILDGRALMPRAVEYGLNGRALRVLFEYAGRKARAGIA